MSYPDDNPKTAVGVTKIPLHLVPPSANFHLAHALNDGAKKYGPYNWRDHRVSTSVYISAARRHLDAFWDGEDIAADSGVHHLGHAMACLAIILDASNVHMLNDDRPKRGHALWLHETFRQAEALKRVAKESREEGLYGGTD